MSTDWTVRVRMYDVGFGDCFLVSVRDGVELTHVLIDAGASKFQPRPMGELARDVREACGDDLAAVVATHAHRDHVSGFAELDWWKGCRVGQVWLPWTEDPKDADAVALRAHVTALYGGLAKSRFKSVHQQLDAPEPGALSGAAFDLWNANLAANAKAMDTLRGAMGNASVRPRYLKAGDAVSLPSASLRVEVLGPSRDAAMLRRLEPPKRESWPLGLRGKAAADDDTLDVAHDGPMLDERFEADDVMDASWVFSKEALAKMEEKLRRAKKPAKPKDVRAALARNRIRSLRDAMSDELLLLDKLTGSINNTSLVLLFEVAGVRLLFPGDAQWGSWDEWMRSSTLTRDGGLDFLKLSHHGSHNGTPQTAVKQLAQRGLRTMASTIPHAHHGVPKESLLTALEKATGVEVVRSDVAVSNRARLPEGFSATSRWVDCCF